MNAKGELEDTGQPVLVGVLATIRGSESGMVMMPAAWSSLDVVLFASPERRVLAKNITYERVITTKVRASIAKLHKRRYRVSPNRKRRISNLGSEFLAPHPNSLSSGRGTSLLPEGERAGG